MWLYIFLGVRSLIGTLHALDLSMSGEALIPLPKPIRFRRTDMLTIKDLSASKELDRDAMTTVRGGWSREVKPVRKERNVFEYVNAPFFDLSTDSVIQTQGSVIDQSYNMGGINLAGNFQNQYGTA